MSSKHSYCSHCGSLFTKKEWPRTCVTCLQTTWDNPVPVGAVIIPITRAGFVGHAGVLLISRGEDPGKGKLAFPGGHLEVNETWQQGCAREVKEEINLEIDPNELRIFGAKSTPTNMLVLFATANLRSWEEATKNFKTNPETEYLALYHEPVELAFPSHTEMMKLFFQK